MRYAIGLALLIGTACQPSDAPPPVTVRDSAGIRIVENGRPAWEEGQGWRVSQDPVLSVGTLEGDPAFTFDRLAGAYIVGADRLTVLDAGAGLVRFFDLDGAPLSTFGGQGDGPGEFRDMAFVGLRADSLWLFDRRQPRITVVSRDGAGFRIVTPEVENVGLGPAGLLPDGSAILVADLSFTAATTGPPQPGFHRFEAAYVRLDPRGALQDTILRTPGMEGVLSYGEGTIEMLRPMVAHSVSHAVRGSELLQGSQDGYEIGVYDAEGALSALIRRPGVDSRVDDEAYDAAVEARALAAPESARPGLRRAFLELARPESRPAYGPFLADDAGFLWVQEFSYDGASPSWAVFDPEGAWLGAVEFPERFEPTQILRDRVVGIWRDELEVEYARVYGLTRGDGV